LRQSAGKQKRLLPSLRHLDAGCLSEIVEDTYVGREWDARQGVWQILIKRWKESEAMLTWQVDTSSGAELGKMLRALPPKTLLRSNTETASPRSINSCAALRPPTPPPRIATLQVIIASQLR
jgi:hypothetical protein